MFSHRSRLQLCKQHYYTTCWSQLAQGSMAMCQAWCSCRRCAEQGTRTADVVHIVRRVPAAKHDLDHLACCMPAVLPLTGCAADLMLIWALRRPAACSAWARLTSRAAFLRIRYAYIVTHDACLHQVWLAALSVQQRADAIRQHWCQVPLVHGCRCGWCYTSACAFLLLVLAHCAG